VAERAAETPPAEALQLVLGYLNFSEGRPDQRLQRTFAEVFARAAVAGLDDPWAAVLQQLRQRLAELHAAEAPAFRDTRQAETVLTLTFEQVLPAYRAHHADLLFHLSNRELLQPFFVVRVLEMVLAQGPLREDASALVRDVLKQLNDYVGHRPVAVLETRPKGEPYDHERVRPVPLYLRGAGVAPGACHALVTCTLEILEATERGLLAEAGFDLDQLDELAFDPRAYDHLHPVNRRPNYVFGEWDPHLIDNKGRYRRFVVRQLTLDAILSRTRQKGEVSAQDLLFEAGAVLAGVILMGAGIRGGGPEAHDSSVNLANLVPRIARYRDTFYKNLLESLKGELGDRLRHEAEVTRQPFGGARQHLNQFMARHRASQLQQRHLALLMAELGYPEASRRQAARIPAASVRLLCEIHIRLTSGQALLDAGKLEPAAQQVADVESLLQRGIACGALADPWNILGFGGLFPLFHSLEDSVRDPRIDELVAVAEQTFNLYARLLAESAASGDKPLAHRLTSAMHRLAAWWDKFATYEVSEVRPVRGAEAVSSAEHVARALRKWHERGEAVADLGFWRERLEGFKSTKSFALVVEALLRKQDYRAALGLLMNWLGQLDQVPLEDGDYSFHTLALRWMLGISRTLPPPGSTEAVDRESKYLPEIVVKFFDFLEANAEDYWTVPRLEILGIPLEGADAQTADGEEEDVFEAAYENMTYQDSTGDEVEAEVLEVGPGPAFDLEVEADRIEKHLRFLLTVARLWTIASRLAGPPGGARPRREEARPLEQWLQQARSNYQDLLALLDRIHEYPVPQPSGTYDSLVEYDRRRVIKDRLLQDITATCLFSWLALASLRGRRARPRRATSWKAELVYLEEALWQADAPAARETLAVFLELFKDEPLLFTPLNNGGQPRLILRSTRAQMLLKELAASLPRAGLIGEAFHVVQAAHDMERRQQLQTPRVTEFNQLFRIALQAAVEAVVVSANAGRPLVERVDDAVVQPGDVHSHGERATAPQLSDEQLLLLLARLILPYLPLWREHSKTLRLSALELVTSEADWSAQREFIQRYGHDLFHVRFMAFGNVRAILHQSVKKYLDYLEQNPDPLHPVRLIEDLEQKTIARSEAERRLEIILQAVHDNYDIYRDYNATATQSDYGENLHMLLDFLRLKGSYERQAWYFLPLIHVHEILARHRPSAAAAWQKQFTVAAAPVAERHLKQLAHLERTHGLRLNTVRDRVEERFVRPLALDRLSALIEPAMNAAGTPAADKTLNTLEEEMRPYAENPTGVGLDVPTWLYRLEATVHQVKHSQTDIAGLAQELLQIPRQTLPVEEVEKQLVKMGNSSSWSNLWPAIINALGQITTI
jgi:hypothetical protein